MTFVSYAQNFEDVILRRALSHVRQGFYVDVGAQHPVDDSVTKAFSLEGWRGINIEPVKHWFAMLQKDRPHDINLNIAIGDAGGLRLFEVEDTGLSTTDPVFAERHREAGHSIIEHTVPAMTLDEVFAVEGVTEVHFLKIDCEGAERAAIASCSFDRVRPWIVLVEATEPNSQVSTASQWEHLLTDRGYVRVYNDGLNLYYVAKERESLIEAFSLPPNFFDDFIRARDLLAHEQRLQFRAQAEHLGHELALARGTVAELARSLDGATAHHAESRDRFAQDMQAQVERGQALEADLKAITMDRDELRMLVASLKQRIEANQHQSMVEESARLLRQQHELQDRIGQLQLEVSRRDGAIHAMLYSSSWRLTAPLRAAKLLAARCARSLWWRSRPAVARVARTLRPAMRVALKVPGVRPISRSLLGPNTRIGRRARLFLFPMSAPDLAAPPPLAMTGAALAMEGLLRFTIQRKQRR